jgi:hypothetical protein
MKDTTKQAQRLLAEIQEATGRAERQLARCQSEGADHFQKNLAMAHERLDENSLDRYIAHARALSST